MLSAFLTVIASAAVGASADIPEPNPKAMSYAEIRAFNAKLTRTHPYYIRCVKSADIGSMVKRNVSCRTNAQWNHADRVGNEEARDVMEHTRSKSWNTGG
jgi:hypothetical protein